MRKVAVYGATKNVYGNMIAAAKSLLAHTHMDQVYFLIEDDVFPQELPDVIQCKNMSGQTWFSPDGVNYNSKWTYMTFMRLALSEILPDESRVLWLDIDTIVEKDISDLFEMDLNNNYVAMVEEPVRSKFPFNYHNSGVMLMDLDKLRFDGMYKKWIALANRDPFTAPDQDVINLLCQRQILTISAEWNSAGVITQDAKDPYIRHYAGYLRKSGAQVMAQYEKAEWRVI